MKRTKNSNIIKVLIIACLFVMLIENICMARESALLGNLDEYGEVKQNSNIVFMEKVGNFIGIIQVASSVISVICLIVLGIKYMMGSVEQKAEYKKTLLPYILGAVMVLGLGNLLNIIYMVTINAF